MTENDFGFSAVDEEEYLKSLTVPPTPVSPTSTEDVKKLEEKLDSILSKVDVDEHKRLIELEIKDRLMQVENLILPLLNNLAKNPEKIYIKWPNREAVVKEQINKILAVTRGQ